VTFTERNQVAFTPTQVEAIRAGMHYGLTMVCVSDLNILVKFTVKKALLCCIVDFYY